MVILTRVGLLIISSLFISSCSHTVVWHSYHSNQSNVIYDNGDYRVRGIYYYSSAFTLEVLPGKNLSFAKDYDPAMPAMSDSERIVWQREDDRSYAICDSIMFPYLIDSCYLTFRDSTKNVSIHQVQFDRYFVSRGDSNHVRNQIRPFDMPNFESISEVYRRGGRYYHFRIPTPTSSKLSITIHLRIQNPHGSPIIIDKEFMYDRKEHISNEPFELFGSC